MASDRCSTPHGPTTTGPPSARAGLEWLTDLEAQQDAKAATLFAIESLPGANRYHQHENRVHGQGWTAQVNGGESIDLTLRGLTRTQALAVLDAMRP